MTFSIWHIATDDQTASPAVQENDKQVVFDTLALAESFINLLPPPNRAGTFVIIDDASEEIVYAENWKQLAMISGYAEDKAHIMHYQYDYLDRTTTISNKTATWCNDEQAIQQRAALLAEGEQLQRIINLDNGKVIWTIE